MSSTQLKAGFDLTEEIILATSRLVDDAMEEGFRAPSHDDLGELFRRSDLQRFDPRTPDDPSRGKRKRVAYVLGEAIEKVPEAGAKFVELLIGQLRGCGGFRPDHRNYCREGPIADAIAAFATQPFELTTDGELRPRSLESLSGRDLTGALRSYVSRAQKGHEDGFLVAGTDKDLLEATAAHVLEQMYGSYSHRDNFPMLLGQAFVALDLVAERPKKSVGDLSGARIELSASTYDLACAINRLRNKGGTGHGRPFLPSLDLTEVRAATEAAGFIAGWMLDLLDQKT